MALFRLGVLLAITVGVGCRDGKPAPENKVTDTKPKKVSRVPPGNPLDPNQILHSPVDDKDQYIPAEFKSGADRWKEIGVYVDGKPRGMLAWAELPLALKPTWVPIQVSANVRYGHPED